MSIPSHHSVQDAPPAQNRSNATEFGQCSTETDGNRIKSFARRNRLLKTLLSVYEYRELVWEMAKRDLKEINKASVLGWGWLVLLPLFQTVTYIVILTVYKGRAAWETGPFHYALYVLSGMVPWQIMTRSLQEAPSVLRVRMELVKQVVYPIEALPVTGLIVGSCGSMLTLLLYLGLAAASGELHWTVVLLPIPFALTVGFLIGTAWLFMIVGVLLKDLREMVTILLSLSVYLSPVLAGPELVGERAWKLILLNPLSHVVISFRDCLYGTFHPLSWALFLVMSIMALAVGSWVVSSAKQRINEYI